jgi:hypothetical protein
MTPNEIIKRLVEKVILPKYPEIKLNDVEDYTFGGRKMYDVRFINKTKLPKETQTEIHNEVKSLFVMSGLNLNDKTDYLPNIIKVWFKTPREKYYSFHHPFNYEF